MTRRYSTPERIPEVQHDHPRWDTTSSSDEEIGWLQVSVNDLLTASMDDKLREMRTLLTMLHTAVRYPDGEGDDATQLSETSGLGPLEEGLLAARRFWPELPITEAQCLRMAVEHLLLAHEDEDRHRSIEDTLADLGLILDLLIRLGDHERALEFVTKIYNTGMDHKRELDRRVSEGKLKKRLSAYDEKMLARKIGIVHMAIQQAGERRQSILEAMHQASRYRINAVLKDTASFLLHARLEAVSVRRECVDHILILGEQRSGKSPSHRWADGRSSHDRWSGSVIRGSRSYAPSAIGSGRSWAATAESI